MSLAEYDIYDHDARVTTVTDSNDGTGAEAMSNNTTDHVIPTVDVMFGVVSLVTIVVGVLGNIVALIYFQERRKKLCNILYMIISSTDIITCIVSLPSSLTLLTNRSFAPSEQSQLICNMCGFVFNITLRYSVFLVASLSTLRAIALLSPFTRVSRILVVTCLTSYAVLLTLQSSIPFFYKIQYFYTKHWTFCSWDMESIAVPGTLSFKFMFIVFLPLELLLPALPIVTSCILTVVILIRDIKSGSGGGAKQKKKASWTIVIVTMVYIILNIPYWILIITFLTAIKEPLVWVSTKGHYLNIFLSRTCVVLNAGLNPVVYFFRMKEMRYVFSKNRRTLRHNVSDRSECIIPSPNLSTVLRRSADNGSRRGDSSTTIISKHQITPKTDGRKKIEGEMIEGEKIEGEMIEMDTKSISVTVNDPVDSDDTK